MATSAIAPTRGSANYSSGRKSSKSSSSALNSLIKALSGQVGAYKEMQGERKAELDPVRQTRADYSKEAAFTDASGLINQAMQRAMEGSVAQILRASEGAGASQSSMRALLTQDAISRAAGEAAALGANQAVQYGGIANQASGVLEALTRGDEGGLQALLSAIQLGQTPASSGGGSSRTTARPAPRAFAGVSAAPGASGGSFAAPAMQLPYQNAQPSTAGFFNRPGGILSNARDQQQFQAGPLQTELQTQQSVLGWRDIANPFSDQANLEALFASTGRNNVLFQGIKMDYNDLTPEGLADMLMEIPDTALASMPHALLYQARNYAQGKDSQNRLSRFEHRAFAREAIPEDPLLALSLPFAIPGYQAYKAIKGVAGDQKARSEGSMDQMLQGFVGVGEGIKQLFADSIK